MTTATRDTLTTGEVARAAGGERWMVLALLRRRLLTEPTQRIGVFRIWGPADVERVRAALTAGGYLPSEGGPPA